MKLQDQVCSLEQAKRLKELGVVQESFFTWAIGIGPYAVDSNKDKEFTVLLRPDNGEFDFVAVNELPDYIDTDYGFDTKYECSAFTVAELGLMLSVNARYIDDCYYHYNTGRWSFVGAFNPSSFDSEAEARAANLIRLIELNKITTEEVNKRLTQ